jgi:hypothetical protein
MTPEHGHGPALLAFELRSDTERLIDKAHLLDTFIANRHARAANANTRAAPAL